MDVPRSCLYTRDHFWVLQQGNEAVVGITDYLQESMGDIVFLDLPEPGEEITLMGSFGIMESDNTVSDLTAPLSGEVVDTNSYLTDNPDTVNEDPYGEGWLIRVHIDDSEHLAALMTPEKYEEYIADFYTKED